MYKNWQEFLRDPNTPLEPYEGAMRVETGRPPTCFRAQDTLNQAQALSKAETDSWNPEIKVGGAPLLEPNSKIGANEEEDDDQIKERVLGKR